MLTADRICRIAACSGTYCAYVQMKSPHNKCRTGRALETAAHSETCHGPIIDGGEMWLRLASPRAWLSHVVSLACLTRARPEKGLEGGRSKVGTHAGLTLCRFNCYW